MDWSNSPNVLNPIRQDPSCRPKQDFGFFMQRNESAMAKVRPGDPRQFLSDYLLDHAPVPEYVRNMEAFDDSDARLEGMDEKIKAGQAALEASRA